MKSIRLTDEAASYVEEIRALGAPYSLLATPGIVEYALKVCIGLVGIPVSAQQVDALIAAYKDGMLDKLASDIPVESKRNPGRPRKEIERVTVPNTNGPQQICAILGGSVHNGSCKYLKRELTATGKAVETEFGIPLDQLTMHHVETQYEPSREVWEAAKASQV